MAKVRPPRPPEIFDRIRLLAGLYRSGAEFSRVTGLSPSNLYYILRGDFVSDASLRKITKATKVRWGWLLRGEGTAPTKDTIELPKVDDSWKQARDAGLERGRGFRRGSPISASQRERLSISMTGRIKSDEARAKASATLKARNPKFPPKFFTRLRRMVFLAGGPSVVARAAGLTPAVVSANVAPTNPRGVDRGRAHFLAEVLGVPLQWLLTGEGPEPEPRDLEDYESPISAPGLPVGIFLEFSRTTAIQDVAALKTLLENLPPTIRVLGKLPGLPL